MYKFKRMFCAAMFAVSLSGCATSTITLKEANIDEKIEQTPHIVRLSEVMTEPRVDLSDIEVFYKSWHAMTEPKNIVNWKDHFQISEGTDPVRKYAKLADVTHYQYVKNDLVALVFLKSVAADQGGDALIDVWRSPAIDKLTMPANVLGYRYQGTVIRYESP